MKNRFVGAYVGLALFWGAAMAFAGARTGGNCAVNDTTDGGGLRTASASYTMDGSIGGIGGISSAASPAETLKAGYLGQLTEVSSVAVTGTPAQVTEYSTSQLSATAFMDDATVTPLAGSEIAWNSPAWPIQSISISGVATTLAVYANTPATVNGQFLGVSGSGSLLVLDSIPDNYGSYAGDGIPDSWQAQYFGVNNPQGVASATNSTGHNNLYTYTADLNPNDPASIFAVVAISNQPPNRVVCFKTASAGRVYRLLYATNLISGVWTNLPGATWTPGLDGQMSLNDTNAAAARFYRVQVQTP